MSVAVVTGAGGGLGRAIALRLAADGHRIVAADIDASAAEATCQEVAASGGTAVGWTIDLRDANAVRAMFDAVEAELGGTAVLVNNAAIFPSRPFLDIPLAEYDDVHTVNQRGYWLCAQAAAAQMTRAGGGTIVNIASIVVHGILANLASYVACKGAVVALTRALARELGPSGIRVNAVAPGAFQTAGEAIHPDPVAYNQFVLEQQALKRRGTPEELAAVVSFLAGPDSSFVTGHVIEVSGGWVMGLWRPRNRPETSLLDYGRMETRRVLIGCDFTYVAAVPTPVVFQVQPVESPGLCLEGAQWASEPAVEARGYTDLYGNPCVRTVLPAGRSSFRYQAVAVVPDATEEADEDAPELAPGDLPDDTLIYTLPSRYCLPDVLGNESWARFGALPPGYRRVQAICDYVHGHLAFQYGSTTALSSAVDVNLAGRGVCRDFTHLAVSFCRALNIPARYVFGYLPDMDVPPDPAPMDFAAWMEVWLGDRWWTFDPRNNTRRKGRIVIGRGRDASDVAMATTFGGPLLESMIVQAEEAR